MSPPPPLIVILGPTASGKSSLAIVLAKKFNGEIINADSRTIYQDMTIGTACPVWDERKIFISNGIPHHLFQIIKPNHDFSVQIYKQRAVTTIFDIHRRGKIPFLVGGTGLYIQAVIDNLEIPAVPPQPELRKHLAERMEKDGLENLWQELIKKDPAAAKTAQKENPRRVIRALEVVLSSGRRFSELRRRGELLFNTLQLGLKIERKKLYQQIDRRTDEMFAKGLVDEVKFLIKKYGCEPAPFHGLIYQQCLDYLENKITLPEAIQKAKFAQHAFARRQITWFKRDQRIIWIKKPAEAACQIQKFLKK